MTIMVDRLFVMFFVFDLTHKKNECILPHYFHLLIVSHLIDSSSCLTSDVKSESDVVRIDAVVAKI